MLHDSPIQVAPKTMSPENSRKLPRDGAAKKPLKLGKTTPQCRLFVESDSERYYATRIERKLRCLGVTCDTVIWKQPINRKGYAHLNKHLEYLERYVYNFISDFSVLQLKQAAAAAAVPDWT